MSYAASLSSSASAIKILQWIVAAAAAADEDFAIVVGSDDGRAREPLSVFGDHAAAEVGVGLCLCCRGSIDYRRGRFCAHIHRRRRSAVLLQACIWHLACSVVVGRWV